MRDDDAPQDTKPAKRKWLVGLGSTVGAGLLVAGVAIVPSLLDGSSPTATVRSTPPVVAPSASPTRVPTVVAAPGRLRSLRSRVLFGVQSVGQDITKGVHAAFSRAHVSEPKVTTWNKARNSRGPVVATALIGRNGRPASKLRAFAALVNDAPRNSVDVAVMAFNYQDITAETDVYDLFRSYEDTMESVEGANPDITFLYSTAPVTSANSWRAVDRATVTGLGNVNQPVWQDNIARERFNSLVRERYAQTGRLYDIAALQAAIDKGKVAAKQHEEQWYYVMNPKLASDGKRLSSEGSKRLAEALMLLVAAATAR